MIRKIFVGSIFGICAAFSSAHADGQSCDYAVQYGDTVGVFAEARPVRLDIGTRAMKKNASPNHESWATRLKIKRLDGPSTGVVCSNHVIGIFSEDGKFRLDIGTQAVKEDVPASHVSWATLLNIQPVDGASHNEVEYGTTIKILSQDNQARLDIGTDTMKVNVAASHDSWATRLKIVRQ